MLVNHMDKAPQRNDFVKQIVGAFHYDLPRASNESQD